jgi:hypothetical protein
MKTKVFPRIPKTNRVLGMALTVILIFPAFLGASPLYSPLWGFHIDLPEKYEYTGGDGKNNFSFSTPEGASFELTVYGPGTGRKTFNSPEALAKDVQQKLKSPGSVSSFEYHHKKSAVLELDFSIPGSQAGGKSAKMSGWGLCIELPGHSGKTVNGPGAGPVYLLALAYGPEENTELFNLHFSALDSIAPEDGDRRFPGPISEISFPRRTRRLMPLAGMDMKAWFFEEDAEAAQALVDREFKVLSYSAGGPAWEAAWKRFYRAIFRDSWDRLSDAVFKIERKLNVPPLENRDFANRALQWVQGFKYERNLMGSDFVNLVSAACEGRGDCDSRAMLWAMVLSQANIPACMMVSREFSHAMGLADLPGSGARFIMDKKQWLVAETTAKVSIGLIGETVSEMSKWIGILFDQQ